LTKFADQLYEDLMREHGAALQALSEDTPAAAPARRRRHRAARPAWLTAGAGIVTAAVTMGFVLFGGSAGAAYAVTQNPDGTVSVAVHEASAISSANTTLKAMGVRAVVVPVRDGCPRLDTVTSPQPGGEISVQVRKGDGTAITVSAKGIPANETLVLGFDSVRGGMVTAAGLVKGKVPGCISLPASSLLPPPPGSGIGSEGQSGSGNSSGSSQQGTTVSP